MLGRVGARATQEARVVVQREDQPMDLEQHLLRIGVGAQMALVLLLAIGWTWTIIMAGMGRLDAGVSAALGCPSMPTSS